VVFSNTVEDADVQPEWLIKSGVFVVTLKSKGIVNAYTAAWVIRVSEVPTMIQIAVWKENYSFLLTRDCDYFSVHILGIGQQEVARHFGQNSGRDMDKLAGFETKIGVSGLPILEDCVAHLECKVIFRQQFGDHMVLVGEVIASEIHRKINPLIYDYTDYR